MINSIKFVDFKGFSNESLSMGPFTIIVGTNASGKSNIRDAFRFIHGIGRGYSLAEIIGGKYGAGGQVEWTQMRGAAKEIIKFGEDSFLLEVNLKIGRKIANYRIQVGADESLRGGFLVVQEHLKVSGEAIYTSHPSSDDPVAAQDDDTHLLLRLAKTGAQRKYGNRIAVRPDQPALSQLHEFRNVVKAHREAAESVMEIFASMRFLDLVPEQMRQPAFPGQTVLGDNGENLPTVLQEICLDSSRGSVLADWIKELTPMDVEGFDFPRNEITGLVQLIIKETGGRRVSSYSASDGTLRFLAMLAALLGTQPAKLYFFEEIDNGIHPSRLRLLLDLIEGQTGKGEIQVVSTTHSPDFLSILGEDTFNNTSVVFRIPESSDSVIRSVSSLPNAAELRRSQGLGRLHASGWMEDAITFTEESVKG